MGSATCSSVVMGLTTRVSAISSCANARCTADASTSVAVSSITTATAVAAEHRREFLILSDDWKHIVRTPELAAVVAEAAALGGGQRGLLRAGPGGGAGVDAFGGLRVERNTWDSTRYEVDARTLSVKSREAGRSYTEALPGIHQISSLTSPK